VADGSPLTPWTTLCLSNHPQLTHPNICLCSRLPDLRSDRGSTEAARRNRYTARAVAPTPQRASRVRGSPPSERGPWNAFERPSPEDKRAKLVSAELDRQESEAAAAEQRRRYGRGPAETSGHGELHGASRYGRSSQQPAGGGSKSDLAALEYSKRILESLEASRHLHDHRCDTSPSHRGASSAETRGAESSISHSGGPAGGRTPSQSPERSPAGTSGHGERKEPYGASEAHSRSQAVMGAGRRRRSVVAMSQQGGRLAQRALEEASRLRGGAPLAGLEDPASLFDVMDPEGQHVTM